MDRRDYHRGSSRIDAAGPTCDVDGIATLSLMTGDIRVIAQDGRRAGGLDVTQARYAKLAGWLYLVVFVLAPLCLVYVRSKLITAGDSGATADAVTGSEWLLRLGSVGELVVVLCDVVLAVAFYVLLRPVNRPLALLAASLRLTHSAITGVNLVTNLIALNVLDSFEGSADRDALALLFLESHDYFFATGLVFFGLHLLVLGYLMLRTVAFPRALGVLLAVASVCYLVNSVAVLMAADFGPGQALVLLPAAVAELALCGWLILGRRTWS
jgi:hypothetical protein